MNKNKFKKNLPLEPPRSTAVVSAETDPYIIKIKPSLLLQIWKLNESDIE